MTGVAHSRARRSLPTFGLPTPVAAGIWVLWAGAVAIGLSVAGAAIAGFAGPSEGALLPQGPLVVKPAISDQLRLLFGDTGLTRSTQVAVHAIGYAAFIGTAGLLVVRRHPSWVPVLGSAMLVLVGTGLFAPSGSLEATSWEPLARLVGSFSPGELPRFWVSAGGFSLVAFFMVFPDGHLVPWSARWLIGGLAGVALVVVVAPGGSVDPATWPGWAQGGFATSIAALVVSAQIRRLGARDSESNGVGDPVVLSFAIAAAVFIVIWALQPQLTEGLFGLVLVTPRLSAIYDFNLLVILTSAVILFPVSIWFAVVRYRLFDIELIVNRALVYGALTGFVAVAFVAIGLLVVLVAGEGFASLQGSEAAVVGAVTGAVFVVAFQPLRRRVQRVVDRRFYRHKYDADVAVERLAATIHDELDIEALRSEIVQVLEATFFPETVHMWDGEVEPGSDAAQALREVAAAGSGSAGITRSAAGDVVVPLLAHGELVGALHVGPRRGGDGYSALDLETLGKLGRTAAPSIRMAQLVRAQERDRLERERFGQELEVARRIQMEMLPKELPALPGWSVQVHYQPAREVGGDFYDFLDFPGGRWGIVVGDVTGKGVPAAMVMTTCRTLLRGAAGSGRRTPGEVLARVNELLRPDIPEAMFVTCLFAVLEPGEGTFTFANAGHDLPHLLAGEGVSDVRATGMPLGLLPAMEYEEVTVAIGPGDAILLSSDGLAESHDASGAMFGVPRIADVLRTTSPRATMIDRLLAEQRTFTGPGWEQEDDITLVALARA